MYSVELPKQLFKRFENCRYNVKTQVHWCTHISDVSRSDELRVINNCAKCAVATVEYSNKKSYKIEAGWSVSTTVIDNTYKTVCQ